MTNLTHEDIQFANSCIEYKRYKDNNQFFNIIKYFIKRLQVNFFKFLHLSLGIDYKEEIFKSFVIKLSRNNDKSQT